MTGQTALITGFEPYGGRGINPSAEVVKRLDGTELTSVAVVGRVLPVSFRALQRHVDSLLEDVKPVLVLSLGLWPGDPTIRIERVAVNVADFEIPDNDGTLIRNRTIVGDGPAALMATVPVGSIEEALISAGVPARVSNSAGTFLCNATLYTFLKAIADRQETTPCGFLHVPYLPEQVADLFTQTSEGRRMELHQRADLASMHLETMIAGVRLALGVCARAIGVSNAR